MQPPRDRCGRITSSTTTIIATKNRLPWLSTMSGHLSFLHFSLESRLVLRMSSFLRYSVSSSSSGIPSLWLIVVSRLFLSSIEQLNCIVEGSLANSYS